MLFNSITIVTFGTILATVASLPHNPSTDTYEALSQNLTILDKRDLLPLLGLVGAAVSRPEKDDPAPLRETLEHTQINRPNVQTDYGNFIGSTIKDVESFTGIPFAEPPVGPMRLMNPIPPRRTYPNFDATLLPPACPQKSPATGKKLFEKFLTEAELITQFTPLIGPIAVGQEDCLTLDVRRPAGIKPDAGLPVMIYIYGGAAEFGATNIYDGSLIVSQSIQQNQPIIYVAMNYRLNAFGFLGGREVGEAGVGNLGLKDQRLAMKWVQKYISQFGGDPKLVTIFGESAGAICVSHHLMAFNGNHEGLFRSAICESGTAMPGTRLAEGGGQSQFNELVQHAGCAHRKDRLQCLREIDFDTFYRALAKIDGPIEIDGVPFRWGAHIDDEFVTDTLEGSLSKGNYAKVPLITGDQDDEGTPLTLGLLPLFTEGNLREYLSSTFYQRATPDELDEVLRLYPEDPVVGSPFDTLYLNILTPIFKQVSALFGDTQFQAPRRKFSQYAQSQMPVWGYLDKGFKLVPYLGAFHGTDVINVFGILDGPRTVDYQSRWIAFANTLNPNVEGLPHWPTYGQEGSLLLIGPHGSTGTILDHHRQEQMQFLNDHSFSLAMKPI